MKVKDLAKVIANATIVKVYFQNENGSENAAYEYGGKPDDTFGVIDHFSQEYGDQDVLNIYPSDKDDLEVLITKPQNSEKDGMALSMYGKAYYDLDRDERYDVDEMILEGYDWDE